MHSVYVCRVCVILSVILIKKAHSSAQSIADNMGIAKQTNNIYQTNERLSVGYGITQKKKKKMYSQKQSKFAEHPCAESDWRRVFARPYDAARVTLPMECELLARAKEKKRGII